MLLMRLKTDFIIKVYDVPVCSVCVQLEEHLFLSKVSYVIFSCPLFYPPSAYIPENLCMSFPNKGTEFQTPRIKMNASWECLLLKQVLVNETNLVATHW
jgi:hypothetical protein